MAGTVVNRIWILKFEFESWIEHELEFEFESDSLAFESGLLWVLTLI